MTMGSPLVEMGGLMRADRVLSSRTDLQGNLVEMKKGLKQNGTTAGKQGGLDTGNRLFLTGRKEDLRELARAVSLEQAFRVPVIKGAATQHPNCFPPQDGNDFPRARSFASGFPPFLPVQVTSQDPRVWDWEF